MTSDSRNLVEPIRTGVIGVGSIGKHHTRVYSQLPYVDLVGVADADEERVADIANQYATSVLSQDDLLEEADAVSVAVPTRFHADIATRCIDAGVGVLVEKPFVREKGRGEELVSLADRAGVTLQVGHIERFNPAVATLGAIAKDVDPIAIDVNRLGPPRSREVGDGVVTDLMIHDIDIVLSLLDGEPSSIAASGTANGEYATAVLQFEPETVVTLTASRLTQRKVRTLDFTTESSLVCVDLLDSDIEIHRQSNPEFIETDDGISYRHESIIERPQVGKGEPLQLEIESFLDSVITGSDPAVSGEDGLRALAIAEEIERLAERRAGIEAEVSLD